MKRRSFIKWVVVLTGFGMIGATAVARDYRLGLLTPAGHVWTLAANSFARDLESATEGKSKVVIFPAAQLGNEAQMLKQLQTGALDMAFMTAAELSNRSPEMAALHAPYLVKNVEQAGKLLGSSEAERLLLALPARTGVVGVAFGTGGMRQVLSRHKLENVADLKGRKLRVTPIEPLRDFYAELGAAPTPIPLSGVFDALSNGQVDAIDMDLELIVGMKFHEQASTILLSRHMMWPVVGVVSARVWKTMGSSEQQKVRALMKKHLHTTFATYVAKEAEWERQVRESGKTVKVVGPDFFADAIEKWEHKWGRKAPALGGLRAVAGQLP